MAVWRALEGDLDMFKLGLGENVRSCLTLGCNESTSQGPPKLTMGRGAADSTRVIVSASGNGYFLLQCAIVMTDWFLWVKH